MRVLVLIGMVMMMGMASAAPAKAAVVEKVFPYAHGDVQLEGWLYYDDTVTGPQPGAIIVHAWRGVDAHSKESGKKLAAQGYVALVIDMYGTGVRAKDNKEAAALSKPYRDDRVLMRGRANAGLTALLGTGRVDPAKVLALGYCFGGTTVLEMVRDGMELLGAVAFHGGLSTDMPAKAGASKTSVLALHGAVDPYVPDEEVIAFKEEMQAAEIDWQLVAFGDAVHAFTDPAAGDDPSRGAAYDALAAKRSWAYMELFFNELLQR